MRVRLSCGVWVGRRDDSVLIWVFDPVGTTGFWESAVFGPKFESRSSPPDYQGRNGAETGMPTRVARVGPSLLKAERGPDASAGWSECRTGC